MKNLRQFLLLVLIPLFSYCSSPKYASPAESPDAQIVFGSGGGYASTVKEYVLLENGQLFKKSSTNMEYEELSKVKKKEVKQIFSNYSFLNIEKINHDNPGNMYQFVEYKNQDGTHRITWSDNTPDLENNLTIFYGNLRSLLK